LLVGRRIPFPVGCDAPAPEILRGLAAKIAGALLARSWRVLGNRGRRGRGRGDAPSDDPVRANISEEHMIKQNLGQSMRFILGAVSAGALVACAQEAVPAPAHPAATKDVCDEAAEYARRAAAAEGEQVRAALQRIADSKSRECASKTTVSLGPSEPSSPAAASASK
jgi:hypothetical protein